MCNDTLPTTQSFRRWPKIQQKFATIAINYTLNRTIYKIYTVPVCKTETFIHHLKFDFDARDDDFSKQSIQIAEKEENPQAKITSSAAAAATTKKERNCQESRNIAPLFRPTYNDIGTSNAMRNRTKIATKKKRRQK